MSTTPKTEQAAPAPAFNERAGRQAGRETQTVYVAPPRRSGIARFFSNLFFLVIALGAAFGGGYFVMDQEAQMEIEAWRVEQGAAQVRIAALEEQISQLQNSRAQENSVELDLTDVFAPIRSAVTRLAEAQVELVARQISAEVVRIVEADVQSMNGSESSVSLASIADAVGAAIEPAVAEIPGATTGDPEGRDTPAPEPEPDSLIEPTGLNLAPTATERSGPAEEIPLDPNAEGGGLRPGPVAELPATEFTHDTADSNSPVVEPESGQVPTPSVATGQLSHGATAPTNGTLFGRLAELSRVKHNQIQESVGSALRQALVNWWDHLGAQTGPSLGSENRAPLGAARR